MNNDLKGKKILNRLRLDIVKTLFYSKTFHYASCLSALDIIHTIYKYYKNDVEFILSKAHAAAALYTVLREFGYISDEEYQSYGRFGSKLICHTSRHVNGVLIGLGALGQGLSIGIGLALGYHQSGNNKQIITLLGDGELNEGSIWEGVMLAGSRKLHNVIALIDRNKIQGTAFTSDIINQQGFNDAFSSFGWHVLSVDGHNVSEIKKAIGYALNYKEKPILIQCNTIKGKGISFIENNPIWHSRSLNEKEYALALSELDI